MPDPRISIFGSDQDVDALEKALSESGVTSSPRHLVQAVDGGKITKAIAVILTPQIIPNATRCICTYLRERNKRLVERYGDRVVIKGYSADEAEQLLKVLKEVKIQDDTTEETTDKT